MLTTMLTTTLYMCRALLRFPQVDEGTGDFDSCEVVDALIATLNADKSKEVRKAVLAVLPMSGYTLPYVVARTRDESDEVRQVALLLLAEKTSIKMCAACGLRGVEMSQLLSKALLDRVPAVVEAGQALVSLVVANVNRPPRRPVNTPVTSATPRSRQMLRANIWRSGSIDA